MADSSTPSAFAAFHVSVGVLAHSIEVRSSPIHGRGVFTTRDLPHGTSIGRYEGQRFTNEELLGVDWRRRHGGRTYLFGLSDGTIIDGARGGNATRFVNHSCSPNCQVVEEPGKDGRLHLRMFTIETIAVGNELFIDYGLTIDEGGTPADYVCRCGSPVCRGSMAARQV